MDDLLLCEHVDDYRSHLPVECENGPMAFSCCSNTGPKVQVIEEKSLMSIRTGE